MAGNPSESSPLSFADFVSAKEILSAIPFSKASLYNWSHSGAFPTPIRTGRWRLRWRRSDVNAWLAARNLPPLPGPEVAA